jgi:hypothetical protein
LPSRTASGDHYRRVSLQFLGPTEHAQTIQLRKTANAFVGWVTGPYPALGTAPVEAMLWETPVVNDMPKSLFVTAAVKSASTRRNEKSGTEHARLEIVMPSPSGS